jgi:hypothetical protein
MHDEQSGRMKKSLPKLIAWPKSSLTWRTDFVVGVAWPFDVASRFGGFAVFIYLKPDVEA